MTFDQAVEVILRHEGGYVDDLLDPGGATKFGISKRAYPELDIRSLTRDEAIEIYRKDYWQAAQCPSLPDAIRLPMFDCAVNQGVRAANVFLQRALNRCGANLIVDGVVGPKTLKATLTADPKELRVWFFAHRAERYGTLNTFSRFGLGWMRRLFDVAEASK